MNNKGTRIYGRAQRIEFFEKVAYFVIAVFAVIIVFVILSNQKGFVDDNVDFAYLKNYMEDNGYSCEMIHQDGGTCTLKGDSSTSMFTRRNDGFDFAIISSAYTLNIKHSNSGDIIKLRTTSSALAGYKDFTCKTKGNVIDELEQCTDEDDVVLDSNVYIGVIERAIKDINNFIDSSGYDKEILMKEHKWQKNRTNIIHPFCFSFSFL